MFSVYLAIVISTTGTKRLRRPRDREALGRGGQHHVRDIFADSAIFCHTITLIVLPVVCDRESLLVVCESRDSDQV